MSDTNTLENQHVTAASSNILRGVYAPAYLEKLASRGYPVKTEKEAEELLQLGFKLQELGTQSSNGQTKYAAALGALNKIATSTQQTEDYRLKQAAYQLAQDPAIYASALVLQEAEKSAQ